MTDNDAMAHLIAEAYGAEEETRYRCTEITASTLEEIETVGGELLRRAPSKGFGCVYLSATWTAVLRDALKIPAYCVTGDLRAEGRIAFGSSDPLVARTFSPTEGAWDGHCWIVVGSYVGDASIFRTAYALPDTSNLKAVVLRAFGEGCEFCFRPSTEMATLGFDYVPKYVLRDEELTGVVKGATQQGLLGRLPGE